jgi:hypothetical protein
MGTTAGVRSGARARWLARQAPDMSLASLHGVAQRRGCLLGNDLNRSASSRHAALLSASCVSFAICSNQQHAYEMSRPDSYRHPSAPTEQERDNLHKGSTHQLNQSPNNSPATHRSN